LPAFLFPLALTNPDKPRPAIASHFHLRKNFYVSIFGEMKIRILVATVIAFVFSLSLGMAQTGLMPKAGDKAPLFEGKDQDGKTVRLADLCQHKKIVLLYFYPKDNTPGCTKEACGFRDRLGELQTNNVEVIGVSFDSAESHKKFIADYKLNFRLLSDPDGKIVDAYGVQVVGRKMARRVSFLIGLDGKIVHVTDAGNPDIHFNEMKDAIAGLKKK
jgi:peroxiredoxin Q/BCP